jgi:hypothetical protein
MNELHHHRHGEVARHQRPPPAVAEFFPKTTYAGLRTLRTFPLERRVTRGYVCIRENRGNLRKLRDSWYICTAVPSGDKQSSL